MRTTKNQRKEILPILQKIVQAKIQQWEGERAIENILGKECDGTNEACEHFAVSYDWDQQMTLEDVSIYLDLLLPEGEGE